MLSDSFPIGTEIPTYESHAKIGREGWYLAPSADKRNMTKNTG